MRSSQAPSSRGKVRPVLASAASKKSTLKPYLVNESQPLESEKDQKESAGCCCWSVLWKKQKQSMNRMMKASSIRWEGDGVIWNEDQGSMPFVLYDIQGTPLTQGRRLNTVATVDDDILVLGNYQIQKVQDLDPTLFRTGQLFLNAHATTVPPSRVVPVNGKFKKPRLLSDTAVVSSSVPLLKPRHDPLAPDAFVLPRPPDSDPAAIVDVVVDPWLARFLRPHQKEGVRFLYECVLGWKPSYSGLGAILADDMGLGKTLQCIALCWTLLKQSYVPHQTLAKRILIVTPATLVQNWKKEFKRWLGEERIKVFTLSTGTDAAQSVQEFVLGARIYSCLLINYERVRLLSDELKSVKFDLIICDEGHRLKSSQIKTTQALNALPCMRRIILSGTPIQNDLMEYFTMVDFVNPGVLGTQATFKSVFEQPIMRSRQPGATPSDKQLGEARSQELMRLTGLFVLRRTSEINDQYLPPKHELVLFCDPSPLQRDLYNFLLESPVLRRCINQPMDIHGQHLVALNALRKLANAPQLIYDMAQKREGVLDDENILDGLVGFVHDYAKTHESRQEVSMSQDDKEPTVTFHENSSGKMKVLMRLLSTIYDQKEKEKPPSKVVVVSNFTQTLDSIQQALDSRQFSYLRLDGQTDQDKRMTLVDKFNQPGSNHFVFLLSTKAGGVGLNLIGASRLVLFDIDWNPSHDQQAMARIWRDGQKAKNVYIYRLLTTETIDEKIFQRQIVKLSLLHRFMDSTNEAVNKFTSDELRDLFTTRCGGGRHGRPATTCQTHDLLKCNCSGQITDDPDHESSAPSMEPLKSDTMENENENENNIPAKEEQEWPDFLDATEPHRHQFQQETASPVARGKGKGKLMINPSHLSSSKMDLSQCTDLQKGWWHVRVRDTTLSEQTMNALDTVTRTTLVDTHSDDGGGISFMFIKKVVKLDNNTQHEAQS